MASDKKMVGAFTFGKSAPRFGAPAAAPEKTAAELSRDPLLVVALDLPSAGEAHRLSMLLQDLPVWFKVGLELFTAEGPSFVKSLSAQRFPVFLDLKFHDIPNTVQSAVRSAVRLGVSMTTLHLSGGEAMARAAVAGREEALAEMREARSAAKQRNALPTSVGAGTAAVAMNSSRPDEARLVPSQEDVSLPLFPNAPVAYAGRPLPLLMGVTVLTSDAGKGRDGMRDLVVQRAKQAQEWGLDGVVCSGREAAAVKDACGKAFLCLCPGIRFSGDAGGDDQVRVVTPKAAVRDGADFLVMGRPILRAEDPKAAAVRALLLMQGR